MYTPILPPFRAELWSSFESMINLAKNSMRNMRLWLLKQIACVPFQGEIGILDKFCVLLFVLVDADPHDPQAGPVAHLPLVGLVLLPGGLGGILPHLEHFAGGVWGKKIKTFIASECTCYVSKVYNPFPLPCFVSLASLHPLIFFLTWATYRSSSTFPSKGVHSQSQGVGWVCWF